MEHNDQPNSNHPNGAPNNTSKSTDIIDNPKLETFISNLSQHYTNPSLFVTPDHKIYQSNTPIPHPAPHQVLLHIKSVGICGSDLHLWHTGRIGPLIVDKDSILGHEAAGEVLYVGSDVKHLKPGDRVSIEPGVPCQKCFLCEDGKYNLCENVGFCGVGTTGFEGLMRRFACHDAKYCHIMPDSMSWKRGALLEPLSVIMHAVAQCKGQIKLGRPLLVCGAGPIGLTALKAARASGAWPLAVTDVDEGRLEFARGFVPGVKTWKVDPNLSEEANAEGVRKLFGCTAKVNGDDGGEYFAPQVVLECTGVESSLATAAFACRRGGLVMVVGVGKSKMNNLPFMHLSLAEIDLRFINRYIDTWKFAMNVVDEGGMIDLDGLVTHEFDLENAVHALETFADRKSQSIKIHVVDKADVKL